jgi:hypothetical protein
VGRESEDSEAVYKHFNRAEQEAFYAPNWAIFEGENSLKNPLTDTN